jgi:hypothetical protein
LDSLNGLHPVGAGALLALEQQYDKLSLRVVLGKHSAEILVIRLRCNLLRKVVHRVASIRVRLLRRINDNHASTLRGKSRLCSWPKARPVFSYPRKATLALLLRPIG